MRLGYVEKDLLKVLRSEYLHQDTILLREPGLYCFLLRCGKEKADPFLEWVVETVLPQEVRKLDAIIEEKDAALALLNDDLSEEEEYSRKLEFNNVGLQGEIRAKDQEIACLQHRYVDYLDEERKNYGMTVIAKNDENAEFPYISICGQHGYRRQKRRMVMIKNPGSTELLNRDTPNAIVTFNLWREFRLIKTDPQRPRDFKLVNMDQKQLLQIQEV